MNCRVDSAGEQARVVVQGEVTIQEIAEFREMLVASLAGHAEVMLDMSGVTRGDITVLQVLCAAHRWATLAGKPLAFDPGRPALLQMLMVEAGFARKNGCRLDQYGTCLWKAGGKS